MIPEWRSTGISQRFINQLCDYCDREALIEKIMLFGSRARGDNKRSSDIDLVIYTKNASHSQQNLLASDIDGMLTPLKLDILFYNRLTKNELISNIERDGVIIYEQGKTLGKAQ